MDQGRNCPVVWGLRNWIQLAVLVLTLGIGLQFYLFVRQAARGGTITIARPAGVEGFLPIGALMGILALCSLMQIRRNQTTCVQCQRCQQVCPAHLQVHLKERILSPECSGCMDCSVVCPVPDTLVMTSPGRLMGRLRVSWAALLVVALFLGTVTWAKSSGHWESRLSPLEFRRALKEIDGAAMQHPSVQFGRR